MKRFKLVATLVLIILVVVVLLQNTADVETQLLWATVTMPRALLLVITLLVGVALGILLSRRLEAPAVKPQPAGKPVDPR